MGEPGSLVSAERAADGEAEGLLFLHHGRGTDEQDLLPLADALHGAIGEIEPSWETPVCISVGLATFPEDGEDFESLLRQADQRMLDLKHKRAKPIAPRPLLRPVPTLDDSPSGPQRSVKPRS